MPGFSLLILWFAGRNNCVAVLFGLMLLAIHPAGLQFFLLMGCYHYLLRMSSSFHRPLSLKGNSRLFQCKVTLIRQSCDSEPPMW